MSETGGPPRFFTIAVCEGAVLLGTCGRGISRSSDGGRSWSPVQSGPPCRWVNHFDVAGDTVFAATQGSGVYASRDNGFSWSPIGLPGTTCYAVLATGAGLLVGTATEGIHRLDHAGTWQRVAQRSLGETCVYRLLPRSDGRVLAGTAERGLWLLDDRVEDAAELGLGPLTVFSLLELADGRLLAGTREGGLLRSDDGGAMWHSSGEGLRDATVHVLCSVNAETIAAGTGRGVAESSDGGETWRPLDGDLAERRIFSLACAPAGLLGGSYDGVWLRDARWEKVDTGLSDDMFSVVAVGSTELLAGTDTGEIRSSVDSGATWRVDARTSAVPYTFVRRTDGTTLVGSDEGVQDLEMLQGFRSASSGAGLKGHRVYSLLDLGSTMLAGTITSGLHRWTAGSGRWDRTTMPDPMAFGLMRTSSGAIVAATGVNLPTGDKVGGVHRSEDDGLTWVRSTCPQITVYRLAATSTGVLLAAGRRSTILRSTDDGATWHRTDGTGLTGGKTYSLTVDTTDRNYLGTGDGLFCSDDAGDSWLLQDTPALDGVTVFDLTALPSGWVVAATSVGVLFTTDRGSTWSLGTVPLVSSDAAPQPE